LLESEEKRLDSLNELEIERLKLKIKFGGDK